MRGPGTWCPTSLQVVSYSMGKHAPTPRVSRLWCRRWCQYHAVSAPHLILCAVRGASYLMFGSAGPAFPAAFKHEDGGVYRGQWRVGDGAVQQACYDVYRTWCLPLLHPVAMLDARPTQCKIEELLDLCSRVFARRAVGTNTPCSCHPSHLQFPYPAPPHVQGMRKEGLGSYTYASGARYEGEWRDNLKDGRGVYYFPKVKRGLLWNLTWNLLWNLLWTMPCSPCLPCCHK